MLRLEAKSARGAECERQADRFARHAVEQETPLQLVDERGSGKSSCKHCTEVQMKKGDNKEKGLYLV